MVRTLVALIEDPRVQSPVPTWWCNKYFPPAVGTMPLHACGPLRYMKVKQYKQIIKKIKTGRAVSGETEVGKICELKVSLGNLAGPYINIKIRRGPEYTQCQGAY